MNADMVEPTQTLEEAQAVISRDIELAEALKRLKSNPDFELIYGAEGNFVKDYALTQLYNLAGYTAQSRVMVHEHMVARSVFLQHGDELLDNGRQAIDKRAELAASED